MAHAYHHHNADWTPHTATTANDTYNATQTAHPAGGAENQCTETAPKTTTTTPTPCAAMANQTHQADHCNSIIQEVVQDTEHFATMPTDYFMEYATNNEATAVATIYDQQ